MLLTTSNSKVIDLTKKLKDGVREVFESDKYQSYLKTLSRFHKYSVANTMLIFLQMPQAVKVAGYITWKKLKRYVKKGERGIEIFAPITVTKQHKLNKTEPATGEQIQETVKTDSTFYKVVLVFDIAQTEGEPLTELFEAPISDVANYDNFMTALCSVSPLPIKFEELQENTEGIFLQGDRIAIRVGMNQTETIQTAIHEIAHAKLFDLGLDNEKDKRTKEVEAESISYVVCQKFGIETGNSSFEYIAAWSKTKELNELNSSLNTIHKIASEIIDDINNSEKMTKE
jgi:antirestriction protein ArdC